MNKVIVIGEIRKSGQLALKFRIIEISGLQHLDVRVFAKTRHGEIPTEQGISFSQERLVQVLKLMHEGLCLLGGGEAF